MMILNTVRCYDEIPEEIVRNGMGDEHDSFRNALRKLFWEWTRFTKRGKRSYQSLSA
jgi:hypothetical protein